MKPLIRRLLPLLCIPWLLSSCSGNKSQGADVTIDGFLFAYFTDGTPPSNATIGVVGRNTDEFDVEFKRDSILSGGTQFEMKGLPNQETVIFQTSGSGLDPSVSFPILIDEDSAVQLGVISSGGIEALASEATRVGGVLAANEVNLSTKGIITGIVAPEGVCNVSFVQLISRESPNEVVTSFTSNGPFYFNNNGNILNTQVMSDTICTYIIFNLNPGTYTMRFLNSGGAIVDERDVSVLAGTVTVGYNVPL